MCTVCDFRHTWGPVSERVVGLTLPLPCICCASHRIWVSGNCLQVSPNILIALPKKVNAVENN